MPLAGANHTVETGPMADEARAWERAVVTQAAQQAALDSSDAAYEQARRRVLRMMLDADPNTQQQPASFAPVMAKAAAVKAPRSSPPVQRRAINRAHAVAEENVAPAAASAHLMQSRPAIASPASVLQREQQRVTLAERATARQVGAATAERPRERPRQRRAVQRPASAAAATRRPNSLRTTATVAVAVTTRPSSAQLAAAVAAVRAEVAAKVDGVVPPPNLGVAVSRSEVTLAKTARLTALSAPAAEPIRATDPQRRARSFHAWRCTASSERLARSERFAHAAASARRLQQRSLTTHFWRWRLGAATPEPAAPAPAPAPAAPPVKRGPSVSTVQRMLFRWDGRILACALRRWRQRTTLVCVIRTEAQNVGTRLASARLGHVVSRAHSRSQLRGSLQLWRQRVIRKARARVDEKLWKNAKEIGELRTRLRTSRALAVAQPLQSPPVSYR